MTRVSISRLRIVEEHKKLVLSGEIDRVNVVRTIAIRVGYPLDQNNYHSFVRRVLSGLGLPY